MVMALPPGLVAEKRLVRELESAGATSPGSASRIMPSGPIRRGRLLALIEDGVIHQEESGRYWIDLPAYAAHRAARRRVAIPLTLAALAVAAALFYFLR